MPDQTVVIDPSMTVNEVVQRWPRTLPVFGAYGIDACCGGAKTLAFVAAKHGFDLQELVQKLNDAS